MTIALFSFRYLGIANLSLKSLLFLFSFIATNATASPVVSTITVTPTLAGCAGTPLVFTITVNPNPTSTYTQSANSCLTGNTFTFTSTGSSGAGYTQTWNFGGAVVNTSTAVSPTGITYLLPGTYTIVHVVTATGGCTLQQHLLLPFILRQQHWVLQQ